MQCKIYVHTWLASGALTLAICLQSDMLYRKVRFCDTTWPNGQRVIAHDQRLTVPRWCFCPFRPDLRGLLIAGFWGPICPRQIDTFHWGNLDLLVGDSWWPNCTACTQFSVLLEASAHALVTNDVRNVVKFISSRDDTSGSVQDGLNRVQVYHTHETEDWRRCCSSPRGWKGKRGPIFWMRQSLVHFLPIWAGVNGRLLMFVLKVISWTKTIPRTVTSADWLMTFPDSLSWRVVDVFPTR